MTAPKASHNPTPQPLTFRSPTPDDAAGIHQLIDQCKPLDLNACYAYLLLTHHFADTCLLAEADGQPVGFVSAYCPPNHSDLLFIWQVAVHPDARGQGLAKQLLTHLLDQSHLRHIRFVDTTISPSNQASQALFRALAHHLDCPIQQQELFPASLFGGAQHEAEDLYRLGPIPSVSTPRSDLS